MSRYIAALVLGLGGVAILLALGIWQVQRLGWKSEILNDIDTRIAAAPVDLPERPHPRDDRYLPVTVSGTLTGEEIHVLFSLKGKGPGYRVIGVLDTGTRRILVDRGFLPTEAKDAPRPAQTTEITGNLYWPDEVDRYTPEPDQTRDIWFARDVPAMAKALNSEPVLIVARNATGQGIDPVRVDSATIPNDHLQYAITWFLLAAVWLGMTAFLLWRIRQRTA